MTDLIMSYITVLYMAYKVYFRDAIYKILKYQRFVFVGFSNTDTLGL